MTASTTSNVLATIGTVCWCVQMIPQIIANYRKKDTTGLPENMCLLWSLCAPFFAVYFVARDSSIPIQLQPHLFGFFCWVVYLQVLYYPPVQRPRRQIWLRGGGFLLFWIVLEVSAVIPLRHLYLTKGTEWPLLIFGIIASVLLAAGLIPPYFELAKRQGRVVGINFIFLLTDFSGAVFSLASLAVDSANMDIMGLVLYTICASLELGIFISQIVWLARFRIGKRSTTSDVESQAESTAASTIASSEKHPCLEPHDSTDSANLEVSVTCVDNGKKGSSAGVPVSALETVGTTALDTAETPQQ